VRRLVVPLAVLTLVVAGLQPAGALPQAQVPNYYHPGPTASEAFQLAESYPGHSDTHQPDPLFTIEENRCWSGATQLPDDNIKAVPGIFCMDTDPDTFRLNVNAFATCAVSEHNAFVQSFRMTKEIPGSNKCPVQFPPRTWFQFGRGIRTWWALNYTQPGTRFILEVTVRCLDNITNTPRLHIDRWTWEVVASLDTLVNTINVLHSHAVSTLEVPCIVGEDLFVALLQQVDLIRTANTNADIIEAQNQLFNTEGLILSNCAFGEVIEPEIWFPNGLPSNLTSDALTPFGFAGIIDTIENPCCCKLLVDLEYIGIKYNIVSL
jgi:hypothetical protein